MKSIGKKLLIGLAILIAWSGSLQTAEAVTLPPNPGAQSGSTGLTGIITSPPPSTAATITTPSNGQSFSTQPITVAGLCPAGLLIKIFDNNIFVGSTECVNGSFSLKVSLISGKNDLIARDYDSLDQQGPDSNKVSVTFNPGNFAAFGQLLSLTSSYAKRGVNPGDKLTWPIIISGGTAPYALSVDWGDSSKTDLLSESFSGTVNISHIYQTSGTYTITIQASDKNGESAFLQLVAVANGPASQSAGASNNNTTTVTKTLLWPTIVCLVLLPIAFWLGQRYELKVLRDRLKKDLPNK